MAFDLEARIKAVDESARAFQSSASNADKAAQSIDKTSESSSRLGQSALRAAEVGVGALVAGLGYAVAQAIESERVMTQTEAVIKSTGGAAGLTAEEIARLAEAESRLTSIDDEVIQSGQNMLLTFTNIGSETFPRATRAMQDLAVSMAGGDASAVDLKGTAIQLGKALNDPVAGITALTRAGITFTDEQKNAIKAMMKTNDIAGAQAIILKELEKEFGGAAEAAGTTLAGKMQRAQNSIDNFAAAVGERLIPVLGDAADTAVILIDGANQIGSAFDEHLGVMVNRLKQGEETTESFRAEMERAAITAGKTTLAYADQDSILDRVIDKETQLKIELAAMEPMLERSRELNWQQAGSLKAVAEAASETVPSEEELKQAHEDAARAADIQREALDRAARAARDARDAANDAAVKFYDLAASLKDATSADLAKAAIDELQRKLKDGVITNFEYKSATEEIMLAHGLATESSLAAADAIGILGSLLATNQITTDQYAESIGRIDKASKDGKVALDELGISIIGESGAAALAAEQTANFGSSAEDANIKVDGLTTSARDAKDAIEGIPDRDIHVGWEVDPFPSLPSGAGARPVPMQHGGPLMSGRVVALHPPEIIYTPTSAGFVMSQADTRKMLGWLEAIASGVGKAPNVTVNTGGALPLMDAARRADARMRTA